MMENRNILFALFSFLTAFTIGLFMSYNSWNGIFFVYTGNSDTRRPAAINKVIDYSHLEGSALRLAAQERLVNAAQIVVSEKDVSISLGHFVTRGENGRKILACRRYNRIELEFIAPGMAVNGHSPTMVIESPCHESEQDINLMSTIRLPLGDLYATAPTDSFDKQYFGEQTVTMSLTHLGNEWPQTWRLNSAKLLDAEGGLTITPDNLRSLPNQLEFSFSK